MICRAESLAGLPLQYSPSGRRGIMVRFLARERDFAFPSRALRPPLGGQTSLVVSGYRVLSPAMKLPGHAQAHIPPFHLIWKLRMSGAMSSYAPSGLAHLPFCLPWFSAVSNYSTVDPHSLITRGMCTEPLTGTVIRHVVLPYPNT